MRSADKVFTVCMVVMVIALLVYIVASSIPIKL